MAHKDTIVKYLQIKEIEVCEEDSRIVTRHKVDEIEFQIICELSVDFPGTFPKFHLKDRLNYGALAHVGWSDNWRAEICIGDMKRFSGNFNVLEQMFLACLTRAVDIVKLAISDREYNQRELLFEFKAVWDYHCTSKNSTLLTFLTEKPKISEVNIRSQVTEAKEIKTTQKKQKQKQKQAKVGVNSYFVAFQNNCIENNENYSLWKSTHRHTRQIIGKGCLIELPTLILPPAPKDDFQNWFLKQIQSLPFTLNKQLQEFSKSKKTKLSFIIFYKKSDNGTIWFGLKCESKSKQKIPLSKDALKSWMISPCKVVPHSKEITIKRGGGYVDLTNRHVCLIGCGSVGGYIADQLCSSGVGKLTLADPDILAIENNYRHILNPEFLGYKKSTCLGNSLESKYPYSFISVAETGKDDLLSYRKKSIIQDYDLIIVAIGSPTEERFFNEYIVNEKVNVPVIYTWIEAFNVGGHSVLTVPQKPGCLACCYINNETLEPGLYPNINFVVKNQNISENLGGCGNLSVPYAGIDAVQTATMTTKLATKYLTGEISKSSTVSWKGSDFYSKKAGMKLTHRYQRFSKNLIEVNLHRLECYVCNQ